MPGSYSPFKDRRLTLLGRRRPPPPPSKGVGEAVVEPGGFQSLTIRDDTGIDVQSSIGVNGSGWVAEVVLKGITSLVGTLDATKLTIEVTDPGFDATGAATTVARTITGTTHVRRQYPNGASKMISTDGTDLTVLIALDEWIYAGTTIISASIASGFYTGSVASDAPTRTNNSEEAYPKPIFAWMNHQQESAGSSFDVEAVAFHRHAQQGRQVACIKFRASDGTNNSAEITVADTDLSAIQTQGNVAEVYKATMDFSGLTQAAMCTVNAKIYPWIGSAATDLSVDGYAWPTTLPVTPLRVLCDRTGAYGGGFAYVQSGASGGTASGVAATARTAPYPTIASARAGLQSWRNTNKSQNNLGGGTIRLMDNAGANQTHTMSGAIGGTAGDTWCNVEPDPLNTGVVTVVASAVSAQPSMMRWRGNAATLRLEKGAYQFTILGPNTSRCMVAIEKATVDGTEFAWYDHYYVRDITSVDAASTIMALPSTITAICSLVGCDFTNSGNTGTAGFTTANVNIGNKGRRASGGAAFGQFETTATRGDGQHARILYNNEGWTTSVSNASARSVDWGYAAVQNLFEQDNGSGNVIALNLFADGDLSTILNFVEMHDTMAGDRGSRLYNDNAASKAVPSGVQKKGVTQFCIFHNYNHKNDRFNAGTGSVGTWAYGYGIGNHGNVSLLGDVNELASSVPTNDNSDNYMGNHWLSDSEYNLFRTALGFTKAQIRAMFTNYTVDCGGNTPAMGGDYHPLSSATHLKSRVPAGKSVLKYDLAGGLRKTDGTGAAGAYEAAA